MDISDSPFSYLAVIPPEAPKGNIRSQEVTSERLARHVAVLFGVEVPDNPAKRTWVADYERLRVNEIARGALTGNSEASQHLTIDTELDVIATATLQKFGPDNKAAIILAGCEVLFNSVLSVFQDVLGIIEISSDNERVANTTILAAWSLLVADMLRAQPALAAAAIKARAVQAESCLEWRIAPTNLSLAPSERPREMSSTADSLSSPQELSVLDRTIPPGLTLLSPPYGKDANNQTLVKSLVNNWCHYILGSADQAVAWITADPSRPQSHSAEAYLPAIEPAGTFISDVLAISPHVRPMSSDPGAPTESVLFLRSEEREDGVPTNQGHTDRLLPRMYSTPEVARLKPRSQRALLMIHMKILQLFRNGDDFKSAYLRARCRQDAGQIVQIARRLWGDTDPMTVMLGMHSAAMELSDLKDKLEPEAVRRLHEVVIDGYAAISAAKRSGVVPNGVWIELVGQRSAEMRQAIEYLAKYDRQRAALLRETHREYWSSATDETGMRDAWDLAFSDNSEPLPLTGMNVLIHNYLALPFRSSDPQEMMKALKFSRNKLLPLRQSVMESRKNETPYRHTLQITVRPVYNLLKRSKIAPEDEAWLVETAEDLEEQLMPFFTENSKEQRDRDQSDLYYLGSLARAQVSILEHRHVSSLPFDQTLRRAANTIKVAWETYAQILNQEMSQPEGAVPAASGTRRFSEFEDYEGRIRTIAEANVHAVAQETRDYVDTKLSRAEEIRQAVKPDPESPLRV